jgi:small-conductance mechanosensitive channel
MDWFEGYRWITQLLLTFGVSIGYYLLFKLVARLIRAWGSQQEVKSVRIEQVVRYFKMLLVLIAFAFVALIWGVDYRGLWLVATSVVAVLGVALFAQWSILSNLTSGVIVFFTFPARVGDVIEIIDGVNSVKGQLLEIGMFQIHLLDDQGNAVVYPNNLLLQKPVKKVVSSPKAPAAANVWKQRKTPESKV